jgi:hypothetical protein
MVARLPLVPVCLELILQARVHGTYNMAIEVFNSLPLQIKEIAHDIEHFKEELESFLYSNSFYLGLIL